MEDHPWNGPSSSNGNPIGRFSLLVEPGRAMPSTSYDSNKSLFSKPGNKDPSLYSDTNKVNSWLQG